MIRTPMLVLALTTAAIAAVISRPLAAVNVRAGRPPVCAAQSNGITPSELAGDPLDNARAADGTIYGYRV